MYPELEPQISSNANEALFPDIREMMDETRSQQNLKPVLNADRTKCVFILKKPEIQLSLPSKLSHLRGKLSSAVSVSNIISVLSDVDADFLDNNCLFGPDVAGGYTSRQILDIVFILRVLRLIRVVDSIKRFVYRPTCNSCNDWTPPVETEGHLVLCGSF